ncbi:MAG: cobalamin biosynthesis protein [Granulosicoccus sp.]|nr:cobalamin biosynthesis protein [Granulosicoccus sp.]
MPSNQKETTIFSLTDAGKTIGVRLQEAIDGALLLHRPPNFAEAARAAFQKKSRCIFVCSTGIVIRVLAPVLKDKLQDPPVIVLDEEGKYVIPLLSGHEGGASAFGFDVAKILDAELVNTSATDYSRPVYSLGVGSDKGCPAELITSLFQESVSELDQPIEISAVASIDLKQNEPGILALANSLSLSLQCFPASTLRTVENQLSQRSDIVFKEVGCYGVAEAAALLAAMAMTGNPAELVVTKRKNSRSTVSVARSYR